MRRATVVTLVSLAIGLAERPARAQEPGAISSAPSVVEPVDNDQAPDAKDTPGARALREGLFVSEALIWAPRSVTRNGVRIPTDTFYRLVGRPDLADKYRSRRAAKGLLIAAGATAGTLVLLDGLAAALCYDCSHSSDGGLALVGLAVTMVGVFLPSDPLGPAEKKVLVDDYNRALRARLDLSSAVETARRTATVSAGMGPDGASGFLSARCAF